MSKAHDQAAVDLFSALGDGTRLAVVRKLGSSGALSATSLSAGAPISRQAIVKHLQVLEGAGLVRHQKSGRQVLYALDTRRLDELRHFLDAISAGWDRALDRLREKVEGGRNDRPRLIDPGNAKRARVRERRPKPKP